MAFQPVIGVGGYGGWRILEATQARQREVFERSPMLTRDIEYFRENIENARTAEDLVKDRRLLTVALGAFGLGDEINKQAFVQKILEGGTDDSSSFANRLGDPRWQALAKAFDYGNITQGSNILLKEFREDVIARYKSLEFERAVGDVDNDMRLAMNFKREIGAIASSESADRSGWLKIMGSLPMRTLMQTALGLPESVAQLDLDKQQEIFADKAQRVFGDSSVAMFTDPAKVDDAIRRFFLFQQMNSGPSASTPGMAALTMLQSSGLGGASGINLLLSQA